MRKLIRLSSGYLNSLGQLQTNVFNEIKIHYIIKIGEKNWLVALLSAQHLSHKS